MASKRASDSAGASRHPVTVVENPPQKTVALLLRVVSVRSTRQRRNEGEGRVSIVNVQSRRPLASSPRKKFEESRKNGSRNLERECVSRRAGEGFLGVHVFATTPPPPLGTSHTTWALATTD